MSAEVRLRRLQRLVLDPGFLGLEPLLDLLLGVHQELGASDLAQDKYVADFLQWGECRPDWGVGAGQRQEMELGTGVTLGGQDRHGESFPFRGPELGPGVKCPYTCAILTGQSRVSRGQSSHDSDP